MAKTLRLFLFGTILVTAATCLFLQKSFGIRQDAGSLTVYPDEVTAGQYGSWSAEYIVGTERIGKGGRIAFEFPHSWHTYPWLFQMKPEQFSDKKPKPGWRSSKDKAWQINHPDKWNYAGVTTSRQDVRLSLNIVKYGLDQIPERFSRTFLIEVVEGELHERDRVTLECKRTSAPAISEVSIIRAAVDADGNGNYELQPASFEVTVRAEQAKAARIIVPSRVRINTPVEFAVVTLDRHANAAEGYDGQFSFTVTDPNAAVPDPYYFKPSDKGWKTFPITFKTPGIHYITATDNKYIANFDLLSNPIEVTEEEPDMQIYWGDLHSHTEISTDGNGRPLTACTYARDISRLDFYAITDHTVTVSPEEWESTRQLMQQFHVPGTFVTFLAYEWSGGYPYGHNNVFHTDIREGIIRRPGVNKLSELWSMLEGKDCFTIPHRTGNNVRWELKHPLRSSIEIYSLHGSSEFYNCPNKYDDVSFTLAGPGLAGPHYARDAWAMGQVIGVIASGDDHQSHPGKNYHGVAAVIAPELTREAIYEAIYDRHTYGTTGHRILLEFTINGHMMGDVFDIESGALPEIHVKAAAMDKIGLVEVMRWDGREWKAVYQNSTDALTVDAAFIDTEYSSSSIYYLRLMQHQPYVNVQEYRPRWVMAWSSPIWVNQPK